MLRSTWQSRLNYRDDKGHIGKLVYSQELGRYLLQTSAGDVIVNQRWANSIQRSEERVNLNTGRPKLFPGEACSARLITLPDKLWEKVGEPCSVNIAALIGKSQG